MPSFLNLLISGLDMNAILAQGEWVLRILIAAVCGCFIGAERTSRNKEAGLRTHAIIALGAALVMVVSKYGFSDMGSGDGARLAAQVVSGIGFLGAGVIFVRHGSISGLTTAAGMWATSGIGLCIGSGLYGVGILATLLIIGLQKLFHKGAIVKKYRQILHLQMDVVADKDVLQQVQSDLSSENAEIQNIKVEKRNKSSLSLEIEVSTSREFDRNRLLMVMAERPYVMKVMYLS